MAGALEEELMSMDDNFLPDVEININVETQQMDNSESEELLDDDLPVINNSDNINNNNVSSNNQNILNNGIRHLHDMRDVISDYLRISEPINDNNNNNNNNNNNIYIDDPCPLYFVSIMNLIYFPVGILIMIFTCFGMRLNQRQYPKKARAYKLMMFTTLIRIGFQLLLIYEYGWKYSIFMWIYL